MYELDLLFIILIVFLVSYAALLIRKKIERAAGFY